MVSYKLAYDKAIADTLKKRFAADLAAVENEGFSSFSLHQEIISPFSVLMFFPIYMAMRAGNEIMEIQSPLRITSYHLMYASRTYATYAYIYGLGCKFYTNFTDGTWLVSNTQQKIKNKNVIILKRDTEQEPTQHIWNRHQAKIAELEAQGKRLNQHISFDTWAQLEQQFDRSNLSSMITIGLIWLALVAWVLYWLVSNILIVL